MLKPQTENMKCENINIRKQTSKVLETFEVYKQ